MEILFMQCNKKKGKKLVVFMIFKLEYLNKSRIARHNISIKIFS